MSKVTDCARALGEAIIASEEYRNMQITEKNAMSDPAVAEAMGRYLELKQALDGLPSGLFRADEPGQFHPGVPDYRRGRAGRLLGQLRLLRRLPLKETIQM